MDCINGKEMIQKAYKNKQGIAAINVSNMESVGAVLGASAHLDIPVIIQVAPMQCEIQGITYEEIVSIIKHAAKRFSKGSYIIHLDHAEHEQDCIEAAKSGFSSVMIDGASLPFKDNIEITKRVRQALPELLLEGELGVLATNELGEHSNSVLYTDPMQASIFAKETGVDMLAISIGNAHGNYKGIPNLNFNVLEQVSLSTKVPLVLHGASGIPDNMLQQAVRLGIAKINFFTEIDKVFCDTFVKNALEGKRMMQAAKCAEDEMCKAVCRAMLKCNC